MKMEPVGIILKGFSRFKPNYEHTNWDVLNIVIYCACGHSKESYLSLDYRYAFF